MKYLLCFYVMLMLAMLSGCGSEESLPAAYNLKMNQFRRQPSAAGKIMMIGDSITELWGMDNSFPAGWVARGIGGDKTGGVIRRLPEHLAENPFEIIILIGTNNLDDGIEQYISDMAQIIRMVKEKGVVLRIVSILPNLREPAANAKVIEFNTALKLLCQASNIPFLDIWQSFLLPDGRTNPLLFQDIVHPSHEGFVVMSQLLQGAI